MSLSAPLSFFYIYNTKWGTSFNSIVESVSIIVYSSFILTLGIAYITNSLNSNLTPKFLNKWRLFCLDRSLYDGDVKTKGFLRIKVVLVVSTILQLIFVLVNVVHTITVTHWSACPFLFPSLTQPLLLKSICVFYLVMASFSTISVSLTTCLFALVTITLAMEFEKLYQVISNLTSSSGVGMAVWEQVRFRHEALVSLVRLHSQLCTMVLGPILVGHVIHMCFKLYYVLIMYMSAIDVGSIAMSIAVLWATIKPSDILENMVSQIFIL